MSKITLQYTLVNDTAVDAVPVQANFTRIEAHINQEVIERGGSVAMTGPLTLSGTPVAATDAASKGYVDSKFVIGGMEMYAGSTDPAGGLYLICDGRSLQSATYPELFAVIGTTYGGSGGNFSIPDMRGRFPIGASPDALGGSGGSRDQTVVSHNHTIDHTHGTALTGVETANHSHGFSGNTGTESADHSHVLRGIGSANTGGGFGEGMVADINNGGFGPAFNTGGISATHYHGFSGTTGGISVNHQHFVDVPGHSGASSTTGSSGTNANMPPYRVVNFIIRVR